ncbi:hypothetical protein AVEN_26333-1 [Araneus ventricosus]|uniref:Parvovirus non-structural protein 1 helicase domain-containing protein n=1 Tax=Araneus ventricosus TaxID=182803 RepID=A0A4Y2ANV8_ARAVE|nr:hypothetical protein AVEN_26333-1 [Araneus ventricosus]
MFMGEITQGLSSYAFLWQDCINKRVIIINESYFDQAMVKQLKVVLEGTGIFVHKKMTGDEYLRPASVLITSNSPIWNTCPQAKNAILARILRFYGDLKEAPFLAEIKKDLHPGWLLEFAKEHLSYFTDG